MSRTKSKGQLAKNSEKQPSNPWPAPVEKAARATPRSRLVGRITPIALALAGGALLSFHWIYEADFWWHLAQGREIAAGRLVTTNLFSGTYPNYPQPFTSWLFELGAYGVWKMAGAAGIQVGQALVIALTLALVYFACRHRATVPLVLAIEALGLFLIEPRAVPRPHLVSLMMMAACTLLVERARASRTATPLLWAIPLIALWSNTHAESLFGAAYIGIFAAGEFLHPEVLSRHRAWIALTIAAAGTVANMANPYGTGLFRYLWENANASEVVQIAEFRPAYLPVYAPFFAYLVCGAALLLLRWRKVTLWEMLVFGSFGFLALRHVRFTSLFFCVSAPIVAARLADTRARIAKGPILVPAMLLIGMLLSPVPFARRFQQLGIGSNYLEPRDLLSPGANAFIRSAALTGPVFNSNNLGGYLAWNLYPDVHIFQDGRFQAYPPKFFANIHQAYQSQPDWDRLVAGVDWAVLSLHRSGPLSGAGRFPREQWTPIYVDRAVAIVVRRSGKFGALAVKHGHVRLPGITGLMVGSRP
ncbi:MAG: hypothetical protein ABSH49_19015 [Bryobacteraceae bacterium]